MKNTIATILIGLALCLTAVAEDRAHWGKAWYSNATAFCNADGRLVGSVVTLSNPDHIAPFEVQVVSPYANQPDDSLGRFEKMEDALKALMKYANSHCSPTK